MSEVQSLQGAKGIAGPCKANWALEDLATVLLLHVRRVHPLRGEEE